MRIYVVKQETTVGPFFSSKEKAMTYVMRDKEWFDKHGQGIEDNTNAYVSIYDCELDDPTTIWDS